MTLLDAQTYILSKNGAEKSYPFDKTTAVYKVGNKMFALMGTRNDMPQINLKCDPIYALELRSLYNSVSAGYHMNKKHWNTIIFDDEVSDEELLSLIDDSYDLVFSSLTKKLQASIYNG